MKHKNKSTTAAMFLAPSSRKRAWDGPVLVLLFSVTVLKLVKLFLASSAE
jgi:hypothetical protein